MYPRMRTGDCSVTNRMHNEFVRIWEHKILIPVCEILHMGITVRVRAGIAKNSHMESPRTHNEFVRIW